MRAWGRWVCGGGSDDEHDSQENKRVQRGATPCQRCKQTTKQPGLVSWWLKHDRRVDTRKIAEPRQWDKGPADFDPFRLRSVKSSNANLGFTMLVSWVAGIFSPRRFYAADGQHPSSEEKIMMRSTHCAAEEKKSEERITSSLRESEVMDGGHHAPSLAVAHQWTHKVNASDDGHL